MQSSVDGVLPSNLTSLFSIVYYQDGYNNISLSNKIEFREDKTPIIEAVIPSYGDVFGGYSLVMTGSNLIGSPSVLIDGVDCIVTEANASSLICTVGARPNLPQTNSFKVKIGDRPCIIGASFQYVLKWSDSRTWGVDLPPVDGDLVYVPKGMTLLVDTDTPILEGIAV